jgi:tetratricopeptide (TPR) repeat protein
VATPNFFDRLDVLGKNRGGPNTDLLLAAHLADARAKYQVREFATVGLMIERILRAASVEGSRIPQRDDLVAGALVLKGQVLYDEGHGSRVPEVVTPVIDLINDARPEASRRSADLGIALMLLGRRTEAMPFLEGAVGIGLPAWDAARWLGLALKDDERYAEAEPLLSVATTCLPGFPTVRLGWAQTLEHLNRFADAAEQYRQAALTTDPADTAMLEEALSGALRVAPEDLDALLMMAEFHSRQGHEAEARRYVDQALALAPGHPGSLAMKAALVASAGDSAEALNLVERAVAGDPHDQQIRKVQFAVLEMRGDYTRMLEIFDRVFPDAADAATLELKASLQISAGLWQQALDTTERCLRANPDSVPLLQRQAAILERLGAHGNAEKLVDEAVARHPGDPALLLLQAEVMLRGPHPGEALAPLDAVLAVDPNHFDALLTKGRFLTSRDPSAAEPLLRQAVEVSPDSADAHFDLGETLRRLGRFEEAKPHLELARRHNPEEPIVLGTLGQVYVELNQIAEARDLVERAVRADPTLYWAWKCFYDVALLQGRQDEFQRVLEDALATQAGDPRALTAMGKTLLQIGEKARAKQVIERAVELAAQTQPDAECASHNETLANAWVEMGNCHRMYGDAEAALRAYNQALTRLPHASAAISGKAWVLLDLLSRPGDARELLVPFVNQPGADPVLLGQYGEALRRLQWWAEADDAMARAARQAPRDTWIGGYRSLLLTEIGRFAEAAMVAAAVAKTEPTAYIFGTLGWACENVDRGDGVRARDAYVRGLELDPGDPWCRKGLGNAYRLLHAGDKAKECYAAVLDSASKEVERAAEYSLSMLGWCHYQLRHAHEAVRLFTSAVGINPESISDWFDLGLALLSAGAQDRAVASYDHGLNRLGHVKHAGRRRGLMHIAINDLGEALESTELLPEAARTTAESMIQRLGAESDALDRTHAPL